MTDELTRPIPTRRGGFHSFDPEFAHHFGVNAAVVFWRIDYLVSTHADSPRFGWANGRRWANIGRAASVCQHFYFSEKAFVNAIKVLKKAGLITVERVFARDGDNSNWAALTDYGYEWARFADPADKGVAAPDFKAKKKQLDESRRRWVRHLLGVWQPRLEDLDDDESAYFGDLQDSELSTGPVGGADPMGGYPAYAENQGKPGFSGELSTGPDPVTPPSRPKGSEPQAQRGWTIYKEENKEIDREAAAVAAAPAAAVRPPQKIENAQHPQGRGAGAAAEYSHEARDERRGKGRPTPARPKIQKTDRANLVSAIRAQLDGELADLVVGWLDLLLKRGKNPTMAGFLAILSRLKAVEDPAAAADLVLYSLQNGYPELYFDRLDAQKGSGKGLPQDRRARRSAGPSLAEMRASRVPKALMNVGVSSWEDYHVRRFTWGEEDLPIADCRCRKCAEEQRE